MYSISVLFFKAKNGRNALTSLLTINIKHVLREPQFKNFVKAPSMADEMESRPPGHSLIEGNNTAVKRPQTQEPASSKRKKYL